MSLAAGTRLNTYEIIAPLGAGGMGEVYRARDTKLQRDVAIKVLPALFASDPERLARFEREARTLAALNHPHIAQVYGIVELPPEGGSHALVMEFVDGEDLSQRIARAGAIPIDEVLAIAVQIAEAVEAAHEQGIVHRDLKPANIMVKPDGAVKVLDFGLAKALGPPDVAQGFHPAAMENSPTITSPLQVSHLGVILGTAAYMAPEQARGKPVDKRADIWAFGCVLYEMLTATRPFAGEGVTDTLAAIVRGDPDWTTLPAGTPAAIRGLLARCLVKDAKRRLRDIGDARIAIEEAVSGTPPAHAASAPASARPPAWRVAALATLGTAIVCAALAWSFRPRPAPAVLRKFELASSGLQVSFSAPPVISPDGRSIVYLANGKIWLRNLNQLESRQLAAPLDAGALFWSPDSAFVGYAGDRRLWKVARGGGESAVICTLPESGRTIGATWGADDAIVFSAWRGSLYKVSARGGAPVVLVKADPAIDIDFHDPHFLRDGRRLIFIVHPKAGQISRIQMLSDAGRVTLFDGAPDAITGVRYAQSGHLIYERSGDAAGVWAVPVDLVSVMPVGDPFPIAAGAARPSVALDGTLVYVDVAGASATEQLAWVDRSGRRLETVGAPRAGLDQPVLSPNGTRVAFIAGESGSPDIWIHDLARGATTRLTNGPQPNMSPAWSANGEHLVFTRVSKTNLLDSTVIARPADGRPDERILVKGSTPQLSPDGKLLVYLDADKLTLALAAVDPELRRATPVPWPSMPGASRNGAISPDGTMIAYASDLSGTPEVYLKEFPHGARTWRVSADGGREPRWARKTGELFFIGGTGPGDRWVAAVTVRWSAAGVSPGSVKALFKDPIANVQTVPMRFDAAADGQRFMVVRRAERTGDTATATLEPHLVVVQNWLSEFTAKR